MLNFNTPRANVNGDPDLPTNRSREELIQGYYNPESASPCSLDCGGGGVQSDAIVLPAIGRTVSITLSCLLAFSPRTPGQPSPQSVAQDQTAVFRINTQLVQTDVMVFDKDGRFVNGLRPEDFELRIDGKVKPISFVERIEAGSAIEESQRARGAVKNAPVAPALSDRGRTIFFYLDDLHLDVGGLAVARKLVEDFIGQEMSPDDEVAIVSASGQIGFLQQLTDNKTVLARALQRIKVRPTDRDLDRPPMTEYQAVLIDRSDRDVTTFFVQETMRNNPGVMPGQAESLVKGRSHALLQKAEQVTATTLAGLENVIKSSSALPGRKLVFVVSGGFVLNNADHNVRQVVNAAARAGAVMYTIDVRGLVAGLLDASTPGAAALVARLALAPLGELSATQDGLHALARDSGGKPIFNTNALGAGLSAALQETSAYYLLAWQPDQESQKPGAFRTIDVKLLGRPALTVRARRGFLDVDPTAAPVRVRKDDPLEPPAAAEVRDALSSPHPERAIPISLSVNYLLGADRKMILTTSVHLPNEVLPVGVEDGRQAGTIRLAGIISNDQGHSGAQFSELVDSSRATWTRQVVLGPGLYQVRVAARDERSGRIGGAHAWVEIPDLASRRLALSSVVVGARPRAAAPDKRADGPLALTNIDVARRFTRDVDLRLFLFAYNATRSASDSRPDGAINVQLMRANRTVMRTGFKKMATDDAEPDRLLYAADLSLADLPPGRYVLQVTVLDRVAGSSASQQTRFEIE
jgi:VWFA-related protein